VLLVSYLSHHVHIANLAPLASIEVSILPSALTVRVASMHPKHKLVNVRYVLLGPTTINLDWQPVSNATPAPFRLTKVPQVVKFAKLSLLLAQSLARTAKREHMPARPARYCAHRAFLDRLQATLLLSAVYFVPWVKNSVRLGKACALRAQQAPMLL
jgi:hypothetical protein